MDQSHSTEAVFGPRTHPEEISQAEEGPEAPHNVRIVPAIGYLPYKTGHPHRFLVGADLQPPLLGMTVDAGDPQARFFDGGGGRNRELLGCDSVPAGCQRTQDRCRGDPGMGGVATAPKGCGRKELDGEGFVGGWLRELGPGDFFTGFDRSIR